jgi:putative Holliday junction resolvase
VSRILGVDLGERRIGLALSDPTGTVASPLVVLDRSGDPAADRRAILAAAAAHDVTRIVVGMPRSLSGRAGPAARDAAAEIAALAELAPEGVVVEAFDERLTTVIAQRSLVEAGVKRADRRKVVDKVAAAVMLQSYLERPR